MQLSSSELGAFSAIFFLCVLLIKLISNILKDKYGNNTKLQHKINQLEKRLKILEDKFNKEK